MKLPLIAALAGLTTAIRPRTRGEAACNAGGVSTYKDGVMGFYQTFCISNNGAHLSPGQALSQDFTNGDSIATLSVTNSGSSGDAFHSYACSSAFGLINVCLAAGDGARTFGGTFVDGSLLYSIAAKAAVRVEKPEAHPAGTNNPIAAAGASCKPTGPQIDTASMDQHAWDICTKFSGRKIKQRATWADVQEFETFTYNNQNTTLFINCSDQNEHVIDFTNCYAGFRAIDACQAVEGLTNGGENTAADGMWYYEVISPSTAKRDFTHDLAGASNLIQRRQPIPKNCINKADPACQIAQWTCIYGSGYTIPQETLNRAVNGFCGAFHGHYLKAGEWFSRVWHNEGHEIWMAIHTSSKVDYLLDINLCTYYFDGIRNQCNTGKGTQGGYDWIPPSGLTFVLGVDDAYDENSEYCGGYC